MTKTQKSGPRFLAPPNRQATPLAPLVRGEFVSYLFFAGAVVNRDEDRLGYYGRLYR